MEPVYIRLAFSLRLLLVLLALHAGAAGCVLALSLHPVLEALVLLLVLASLQRGVMAHALRRGAQAIVEVVIDTALKAQLVTADGRRHRDARVAAAFAHPAMVLLRFRCPRRTLFLLAGTVDPQVHRRVCALVKLGDVQAGG